MLIFFDIDGTLTETISGETFGQHPRDFKVIEGVGRAFKTIDSTWLDVEDDDPIYIGISNQGGVEKGHKTLEACIEEQIFKIDLPEIREYVNRIFFCPDMLGETLFEVCHQGMTYRNGGTRVRNWSKHIRNFSFQFHSDWSHSDINRKFRKPEIGMLLIAAEIFASPLDKSAWLIGDRPEDRDCAKNANINFADAIAWRNGDIQILP